MEKRLPAVDVEETGRNINRKRMQNGFSVKDMQKELGFSTPQAIYKWIHGKNMPSVDNLVILAHMFSVTIDELVITKNNS